MVTTYNTDVGENMARDAAKKYGIPEAIFIDTLKAKNPTLNPYQVNADGSGGVASLSPAMAEKLGANTFDPSSAFDAAAKIYKQALLIPENKTADSISSSYFTINDKNNDTKIDDFFNGNSIGFLEAVKAAFVGADQKTIDKVIGAATAEQKANDLKGGDYEGVPFYKMSGAQWSSYFRDKGLTFLFFIFGLLVIIYSLKTFIESQK